MKKEFIKIKGKSVGYIDYEKKAYYSPRNAKKHYFYIHNGFGLSVKIIDYLLENDIYKVILDFGGRKLETPTLKFITKGKPFIDDGDEQLILEAIHFNQKPITEIQSKI